MSLNELLCLDILSFALYLHSPPLNMCVGEGLVTFLHIIGPLLCVLLHR